MLARLLLFAATLAPLAAQDQDVSLFLRELRAKQQQHDDALDRQYLADLQRRLEIYSNPQMKAGLYSSISVTYQSLGDLDAAIAAARNAKELIPASTNLALNLAKLLAANGQSAELAALLGVDPADGAALLRRASDLSDGPGGDPVLAAECAQRALKLQPDDRDVANTAGGIYLKVGRADNAITVFTVLVAQAPQVSTYHYRLALAFSQKNAAEYARSEMAAALQANPPDEEKRQIEQLLAKLK
jgi:tetratricopeptide (TPR) repeat protein